MSLTNTSFNQIFISHWLNRSTNSIIHLQNEISKEKEICSISMHSHVHSHFAQPFQGGSNPSSASSTSDSHALTPIQQLVTKTDWIEAIEQQHLERSTCNRLIINYLITGRNSSLQNIFKDLFLEGFKDAAQIFAGEASISLNNLDLNSVDERLQIRQSIENGNIQQAIRLINEKAPDLLDQNKHLAFHLKQQHLIELIRSNEIDEALTYAQLHLAEFAEDQLELRQELEKTMALMVFDKPLESPYGYLMINNHRQQVANTINSALLNRSNQQPQSDLSILIKMVQFIQDKLDQKALTYPKLIDIQNGKLEDP